MSRLCLIGTLCLVLCTLGVFGQSNPVAAPGFYAQRYTTIVRARGMDIDDAGDVLVVTDGGDITAIYEQPANTVRKAQIVPGSGLGLNHGIAIHNGFLYASSQTTVRRWAYTAGQRAPVSGSPTVVVQGIPAGGHSTRTIAFDNQGRLYVSIGSERNVDSDSSRSRIRRFNLSSIPTGGHQFNTAEIFADGLRNEVGLAFDAAGTLWGVENGGDNLNRPDLGGDIHNSNPAEELNKFDGPVGSHYGYPYCFSTHTLQSYAPGTQFAWPSFMPETTDAWCRTIANNRPPALAMPAHVAPLGISFYGAQNCSSATGAFPCSSQGHAFVAYHGSWNANPRVGRKVVQIPMQSYNPVGTIQDVLYDPNPNGCNPCFRPVNAIFDKGGHLIISADETGEIWRVFYGVQPPPVSQG